MWDSNMTDEYFVAVREFNLSWSEIVTLGRNPLEHAFVDEPTKQKLLANYEKRIAAFAGQFQKGGGWTSLEDVEPVTYAFICKRYSVCLK
jgi:adenosine deaminase